MRGFYSELNSLSDFFGFNPALVEQGSADWHRMRLGCVTASKAENFLAKPGTAKRDGYMAELVGQICTGLLPDQIKAAALEWGNEHEDAARFAYSADSFEVVKTIPFIYKDSSKRFGCSPDGLCKAHGLELKCPVSSRVFIEFACAEKVKPEYVKQAQFSMWVSGLERWDFANFDPRMKRSRKLHRVSFDRDEKMMKAFDESAKSFCSDMDEMLDKLGVKFGDQWK